VTRPRSAATAAPRATFASPAARRTPDDLAGGHHARAAPRAEARRRLADCDRDRAASSGARLAARRDPPVRRWVRLPHPGALAVLPGLPGVHRELPVVPIVNRTPTPAGARYMMAAARPARAVGGRGRSRVAHQGVRRWSLTPMLKPSISTGLLIRGAVTQEIRPGTGVAPPSPIPIRTTLPARRPRT
jgi:hypothetical protein